MRRFNEAVAHFWPIAVLVACGMSFGLQIVVTPDTMLGLLFAFFNSIALGTALTFGLVETRKMITFRKREKQTEMLPKTMQELGYDEERGVRIIAVELFNGEARTIELPLDYSPMHDNGRLMLRTAAPELFEPGGLMYGVDEI